MTPPPPPRVAGRKEKGKWVRLGATSRATAAIRTSGYRVPGNGKWEDGAPTPYSLPTRGERPQRGRRVNARRLSDIVTGSSPPPRDLERRREQLLQCAQAGVGHRRVAGAVSVCAGPGCGAGGGCGEVARGRSPLVPLVRRARLGAGPCVEFGLEARQLLGGERDKSYLIALGGRKG